MVIGGASSVNTLTYLGVKDDFVPGETMRAYTAIEQHTAVVVSKDLTGLDFTTGYRLNLPAYFSAGEGLSPRGIRLLPH